MKKINNNIIGILFGSLAILLFSAYTFVWKETPIEYLNRIDTSYGTFVQSKEFKDFKIKLAYQPSKYLAREQIVKSGDENNYTESELIEEYSNYSNYTLTIENKEGGPILRKIANSLQNYQALVNYLSFDIKDDLYLCTQTDTIQCSFSHFERNFDVAPYANIDIGFSVNSLQHPIEEEQDWVIKYYADRFGLGPLNFNFKVSEVIE